MNPAHLILCSLLFDVSNALHREWIPDTDFHNATNWDKGRVPCKNDHVYFSRDQKIPVNGEFIFKQGAGFVASDGQSEAGCEKGEDITFKNPNRYQWFDPKYWLTPLSSAELENEPYLFTMDEERVPCQYDDIIFQPESSFRVGLDTDAPQINVKTISIMNKKFTSNEEFGQYQLTNTGKLQFHGSGSISLTNKSCEDKSGCECGNSANLGRICSNLQQDSGSQCPGLHCANALKPQGHCCGICGAIIYLEYNHLFDIEAYREQLINSFLGLSDYRDTQMAISKVYKERSSAKAISDKGVPQIQVVLIDSETESKSGTLAAKLAQDIMEDIKSQGNVFGITEAEHMIATGIAGDRGSSGQIAGIVVGIFIAALLFGGFLYLILSGKIRVRFPLGLRSDEDCTHLETSGPNDEEIDQGFDNPTFNTLPDMPAECNAICSEEIRVRKIAISPSQMDYPNPLFETACSEKDC
uniref:Protein amnionless n=1 Tax=Callorhinchus milii TaxID=7868 RepID=A0A4W3JRG5_CALMI